MKGTTRGECVCVQHVSRAAEMAAATSQTECSGRQLVLPQWQFTADPRTRYYLERGSQVDVGVQGDAELCRFVAPLLG